MGLDIRCTAASPESRADDEVLAPLRGGDGAGGAILDPRHCAACEATVTVVIVAVLDLVSLVFCNASLSKFERLAFKVN